MPRRWAVETAPARDVASSLRRMLDTCEAAVRRLMLSASAISGGADPT